MNPALPPVYPIVDVRGASPDALIDASRLALRLGTGGAELVQLRAKDVPAGALASFATELRKRLEETRTRLVVNDRCDVAAAAGAAGVHLGDEDLPVRAARKILGPVALIGFSTHAHVEMTGEAAASADYFGFGPVFESPTKPGARAPRGIRALAAACRTAAESRTPVAAIGGITLDRAPSVWGAGAASVAVISEFARADQPERLVRAYLDAYAAGAYSGP